MNDHRALDMCVLAFGLSLGFGAYRLAIGAETWPALQVRRYVAELDRLLEASHLRLHGARIAVAQAVGIVGFGWIAVVSNTGWWAAVAVSACALLPKALLLRAQRKRVECVETGLHTFSVSLANALKTTPSIGKALGRVQAVTGGPLAEELALTLKELQLGTTVEQALLNLGARVQSPSLDVALSGVLIGRQVGGPIAAILERTASTLREMERLSGVLRTKTAEGKGQVKILALAPAVIVALFELMQPGYFDPLFESVVGLIIITTSVLCWVSSIFMARKILAVEL